MSETPGGSALAGRGFMFMGLSGTLGARRGYGLFGGLGSIKCDAWICPGYGVHVGHRYSEVQTSFVEGGGGLYLLFFPLYAGAGVRFKQGKPTGGQVSVATGVGPLFLVTRAYIEDRRPSAEVSVALAVPIPFSDSSAAVQAPGRQDW